METSGNRKSVSGGILITCNGCILLGHATGTPNWDIPKGKIEEGESPIDGAVRETLEETGLVIDKEVLTEIGRMSYIKGKDLHLFRLEVDSFIRTDIMKCSTYCTTKRGDTILEVDDYMWVPFSDVSMFVGKTMGKILDKLLNQ